MALENYGNRTSYGRLVSDASCSAGVISGEVSKNLQFFDHDLESRARGCTPRVQKLRKQYFMNRPTVCLCRARAFTESYKATEGMPVPVRRGLAFKYYSQKHPIVIQPDEIFVGTSGCQPRSAVLAPDFDWQWIEKELDELSSRPQDPYLITDEQKKILREEILPYWKGKSVYDYNMAHLPDDSRRLCVDTGIIDVYIKQGIQMDHCHADWRLDLIPIGLKGVYEKVEKALEKLDYTNPEDLRKIQNLQGMKYSLEAVQILAQRYSDKARELAEAATTEEEKKNYTEIADVMAWVPWNPPRTLREYLQAEAFAGLMGLLESGIMFGGSRLDQDMISFYRKDIAEGRLTEEGAKELYEAYIIKRGELVWVQSGPSAKTYSGYQAYQNATIGGTDKHGRDAVNECSYLILEAVKEMQIAGAGVIARVNRKNPDKFVEKLCDLAREGTGYPAMYNDDVGIPGMLSVGVPPDEVMDYSVLGCSESNVAGKMWKYSDGGQVNIASALEFALNDGYCRLHFMDDGQGRWGLPTGDPKQFKSFDEVLAAFEKQFAYLCRHTAIINQVIEQVNDQYMAYPYQSSLFWDCIGKGEDYTKGGCLYNVGPAPCFVGLADVANSLAAIKKLVFEEKVLTMEQLIEALDHNFEGYEDVKMILRTRAPKYGNADPYVDDFALYVTELASSLMSQYKSYRGVPFTTAFIPMASYVPLGWVVGALPSGRCAEEPLADGASPNAGTDESPTTVIQSVTSFDHIRHTNGVLLNMKFTPATAAGDKGLKNLAALVRSFFYKGGWHIQFNCRDAAELRDAQVHPEKHTDMIVRVAGYSAYFNDLGKETQDSIIDRTEHKL